MFERYAIFYTPTGPLADFGAAWLGWDNARGCAVPHPRAGAVDVATVTATPRKYGFHATLKAPFRLCAGDDSAGLQQATADLATRLAAVAIGRLELRYTNGFVALRPVDPPAALRELADDIVTALDRFRAPLSDAEVARRRRARLSPRQEAQMLKWGYPYIFDDFHFHLTLSGRLRAQEAEQVMAALRPALAQVGLDDCRIDAITLMGQNADGLFHQIQRHALTQ